MDGGVEGETIWTEHRPIHEEVVLGSADVDYARMTCIAPTVYKALELRM